MSKVKEALKSIFFPVAKEKAEAEYKGIPLDFNSRWTHWVIANPGTKKQRVVNSCSEGYELIPNEQLMSPLIELLEKEFDIDARVAQMQKSSRFYIELTIKDKSFKVGTKDLVYLMVRINNSYDGAVKYGMNIMFWRKICDNGLHAWVEDVDLSINAMHTIGVGKEAAEKTMSHVMECLKIAPKMVETYQKMNEKVLSEHIILERLEEVVEETRYPKKKKEPALARLTTEHKELGLPYTDWLLYNSLNFALYQEESAMKQHKKDQIDRRVLDYIINQ